MMSTYHTACAKTATPPYNESKIVGALGCQDYSITYYFQGNNFEPWTLCLQTWAAVAANSVFVTLFEVRARRLQGFKKWCW